MNRARSKLIQKLSIWLRDITKFDPKPSRVFEFNSDILNSPFKVNLYLGQFKGLNGPYIYRILIRDKKYCGLIKRKFDEFQIENKLRSKEKKRHISRYMRFDSKYLYVGSKRDDIVKRISQHLGYGPARTYSLDMRFWFPKKILISIEVYSVNLSNDLLVVLEQQMWENLKPMFGKQSGL
jgi:hypothetical protein